MRYSNVIFRLLRHSLLQVSAGCHFNQHKRRLLERQDWAPVGVGTRVVHPMIIVLSSGLHLPYDQDQASWIRAIVFVYLLVAS